MYIVIGSNTYTQVTNLSFAPETDVTGNTVPVNRFSADIITTDTVNVGGDIYLYDDLNTLWAKFWLTDAYRLDENTVRVTAQSLIAVLNRIRLSAQMYSGTSLATVIAEIFASVSAIYGATVIYEIDSTYNSDTISGYTPAQSARERLQWVLLCIGAYCKQSFTDHLKFLPVSNSTSFVPINCVKWKPEYGVSDYVTAVTVIAYTYAQGTPVSTDDWVEVNGVYYIQTTQEFTLTNPLVPSTAPENIIKIDGVTLINTNNVSEILTRLSTYYFLRGEVSADVINNAEYIPGQRVMIPVDDNTAYAGFIRSESFTFGLQAMSRINLTQTEAADLAALHVICQYNGTAIKSNTYLFPVDYAYTIENLYIEFWNETAHSVLYPTTAQITGTVPQGGTTVYVQYGLALMEYIPMGTLQIYSVDEATQSTETEDETNVEVLTIG